MPGTRRVARLVALWGGLAVLSSAGLVLTPPASADTTDGSLTVVVERDVNADGSYDPAVDIPQAGIGVAVSDAVGTTVSGTTDSHGEFVLTASEKLLGGRYFVVAQIPGALSELSPVPKTDSFESLSTTVDVTSGDQLVRMGVTVRGEPVQQRRAESQPVAPAAVPPLPGTSPSDNETDRFAVGDLVFTDSDRSGQQDPGEPPAPGVSVQLLDGNEEVLASTVTSGEGRYVFDRLGAGTYSVRFAGIPNASKLTGSRQGEDRARDSDPDYTGATPPFTLGTTEPDVRPSAAADRVSAGYINPTIDAGITSLRYAVGDQVWLDTNRDGLRQPDEPAAAATVTLLTDRRAVLATTTTDAQGRYQFAQLPAGRYRLKFTGLPRHRAFTKAQAGGNESVDSDPDPRTGVTGSFRLDQNAPGLVPAAGVGIYDSDFVNLTMNAGLIEFYSLGDTVWRDNGDGVLGAGDDGVAGVRVDLLGSAGQVLGSKTTSAQGRFTFVGLPAGDYQLQFSDLPSGLVFVAERVGTNPAVDSDASSVGRTPTVSLGEENPADTTVDAGLTTPADLRSAGAVPGAAAPVDAVLASTGGVAVGVPVGGLALTVAGLVCLLVGLRREPRTRIRRR